MISFGANWGRDSSVGIARPTEKPDVVTRVRVPGAARDFSPRVNF